MIDISLHESKTKHGLDMRKYTRKSNLTTSSLSQKSKQDKPVNLLNHTMSTFIRGNIYIYQQGVNIYLQETREIEKEGKNNFFVYIKEQAGYSGRNNHLQATRDIEKDPNKKIHPLTSDCSEAEFFCWDPFLYPYLVLPIDRKD